MNTARATLAVTLATPLGLFCIVAWLDWRATMDIAWRDLVRTDEVAVEHATKVFDSERLVAERVADLMTRLDRSPAAGGAPAGLDQALTQMLERMIEALPQVSTTVVTDATGRIIVASQPLPPLRRGQPPLSIAGRPSFQAVRAGPLRGGAMLAVSRTHVGLVLQRPVFGLVLRREAAGHAFAGAIAVGSSPSFFETFWQTLIGEPVSESTDKCVLLLRDDGAVLAGYPAAQDGGALLAASLPAGLEGRFVSRTNAAGAPAPILFVGHRLAGYPLSIVVGRSRASIVARWRLHVGRDMLFGVPAMLLLVAASLAALGRARREAAALARLRGEMARREVAEAALVRAQRLEVMGQLTSGIAHDFNNLLSILTGQLELIGREPTASTRLREMARIGLNATGRGAELTSRMLAFSRREAVRPEPVDASRVLGEFAPVLRGGAGSAVDLTLELAPALPPLSLDPGELEAAVLNLVTNARDAMLDAAAGADRTARATAPPRILVSTALVAAGELAGLGLKAGCYVRVAVADTGPGMSAAVAARAFEPFFTSKEVGRGTGLGLSQVYGFCRSAGGLARILSRQGIATGSATGATVEMLLPAASTDIAGAAPPAAAARPTARLIDDQLSKAGAGKVVLVAEDEAALREVVVENLAELGYTVIAVADGRAALAELDSGRQIDVLFSDVMMPGGVDGLQLMQTARRQRPELRIVLTSGAASVLGGMPPTVRMLAKPYRREQLARCLVG